MNKKELKKIIQENILVKKETDDNFFLFPNNGKWIFDFRRGFLKGSLLEKFSKYFWDKYETEFPFQVGGLEIGSIPFITGIVYEGLRRGYDVNSFVVRKERKPSGRGNKIEGILNDEKIIVVDDLLNSGESLFKVNDSVEETGRSVFKFFVFINFGRLSVNKQLEENKMSLDYEFTLNDFGIIDIYDENGFKHAIMYPMRKFLFSLENPNKFLQVPKSNPTFHNNILYFGGEGGKIVGINKETGVQDFSYQINTTKGHKNILSSPAIFKEHIIFGGYDGNIHCVDLKVGKPKWINTELADFVGSSPSISLKDNSIFIGLEHSGPNLKGSLVSIDFDTGACNWQIFFDDFVHCSPAYNEKFSLVFCGSNNGKLIASRSDNGKVIFERFFQAPIKGGFEFSKDGKIIYFGCFDKRIYALDVLYGKIIFAFETDDIVYAKPLVIGDNIFIGGVDKFFYHLDSNGNLINKVQTQGKTFSQATFIKDNIIAFGSNDAYIYFYDFKIKKILFVIEHPERISTKLIYEKEFNSLYVLDFLNNLVKYNINFI